MPTTVPTRKPRGIWDRACYILEKNGLDPSVMYPADWNGERYWHVEKDHWVHWPSSFTRDAFNELTAEVERIRETHDYPPAYGGPLGEWPRTARMLVAVEEGVSLDSLADDDF